MISQRHMESWSDITINHAGETIRLDGIGFSAIGRLQLLQLLQARAARAGVVMHFETLLTSVDQLAGYDLIVAADGINSLVRRSFEGDFKTSISYLDNKFAWFGTTQRFDTLSQTFVRTGQGTFQCPSLPLCARHEHVHRRVRPADVGALRLCDTERRRDARCLRNACSRTSLHGHPLISNKSVWRNFPWLWNDRWSFRNMVLVGDALHTAHFSIGSGTRLALEDVIALVKALEAEPADLGTALRLYETKRRPVVEKLVAAAKASAAWYENFATHMALAAARFRHELPDAVRPHRPRSPRKDVAEIPRPIRSRADAEPDGTRAGPHDMLAGCVPWPEDLARTYRERGYWRDVSIPHHFAEPDRRRPRSGCPRRWRDAAIRSAICWMRSERLAAHLHALGLRSRQIVVFQLPNSAEFLVTFLALMRLGVIPVMALPSHRQTEIEHYVRASGAVALFIAGSHPRLRFPCDGARAFAAAQPALRHVFVKGEAGPDDIVDQCICWRPTRRPPSPRPSPTHMPDPSDVALMLLSGGTTALPKLIPRTHNDYRLQFRAECARRGLRTRHRAADGAADGAQLQSRLARHARRDLGRWPRRHRAEGRYGDVFRPDRTASA